MVVLGRRLMMVSFVLDTLQTFSVLQSFAENCIIWMIQLKWVLSIFLVCFDTRR